MKQPKEVTIPIILLNEVTVKNSQLKSAEYRKSFMSIFSKKFFEQEITEANKVLSKGSSGIRVVAQRSANERVYLRFRRGDINQSTEEVINYAKETSDNELISVVGRINYVSRSYSIMRMQVLAFEELNASLAAVQKVAKEITSSKNKP